MLPLCRSRNVTRVSLLLAVWAAHPGSHGFQASRGRAWLRVR